MYLSVFSKIFKQSTLTGIDIQPEGVQLVQLRRDKQGYELRKAAGLPLDANLFADGRVTDWGRLAALLYDWVREIDVVGAVTAVAMPIQMVKLLRADGSMWGEVVVRAHLESVLPGLGETLAVDYCPLVLDQPATLIVAAKHDYLDHYVACLQEAGLVVKIMDVESLAIARAFGVSLMAEDTALLWQQRGVFTLIRRDEKQLPQLLRWPASYGEQVIAELSHQLKSLSISRLIFCGSSYYRDLFKNASHLPCGVEYFAPAFSRSGVNMSDYLLAMGLAMREVPAW